MFPATQPNLTALPASHSIHTNPCVLSAHTSLSTRTLLDSTHPVYTDPAIQYAYATKPARRTNDLRIAADAYNHVRRDLLAPVADCVGNVGALSSRMAFQARVDRAFQCAGAAWMAARGSACPALSAEEDDGPERALYFEDWDGLEEGEEEEEEEVVLSRLWRCADVKEGRSCWADEDYGDEEEVEGFIVGWTPEVGEVLC